LGFLFRNALEVSRLPQALNRAGTGQAEISDIGHQILT
jgi:hypothetical protein